MSGKNRKTGPYLHTNFTIEGGDFLALTNVAQYPISPSLFRSMPSLYPDTSFAYFADGAALAQADSSQGEGSFAPTNDPTPGGDNSPSTAAVILDPGHGIGSAGDSATTGLSSSGTTGIVSGVAEYKATWLVATQVKAKIEEIAPSIKVKIAKDSQTNNISNLARARQLGDLGAKLLISLHFDGFPESGQGPRRTHAIVLPERFQENIGGVVFKTNNRNQQSEIEFGQKLVDAVVAAITITGLDEPVNGGVNSTGSSANKGVLFETTSDWTSNIGPNGERWEERLYHSLPSTPTSARGKAVLLEIDNFRNWSIDDWLNENGELTPARYQLISNAIAQVIVTELQPNE